MDLSLIKKVMDSEEGRGLKEFIFANILLLKSIDNIEEKSTPTQTALELKANKRAYKILVNIFNQIITWSESDLAEFEKKNDWGVER